MILTGHCLPRLDELLLHHLDFTPELKVTMESSYFIVRILYIFFLLYQTKNKILITNKMQYQWVIRTSTINCKPMNERIASYSHPIDGGWSIPTSQSICTGGNRRPMQEIIERNGIQIILDTDHDACLFAAPEGSDASSEAYVRGKDLYVHEGEDGTVLYYLVLWSLRPPRDGNIRVISPLMAERFLGHRGLECHVSDNSSAYAKLKNYGYGIAEEF